MGDWLNKLKRGSCPLLCASAPLRFNENFAKRTHPLPGSGGHRPPLQPFAKRSQPETPNPKLRTALENYETKPCPSATQFNVPSLKVKVPAPRRARIVVTNLI